MRLSVRLYALRECPDGIRAVRRGRGAAVVVVGAPGTLGEGVGAVWHRGVLGPPQASRAILRGMAVRLAAAEKPEFNLHFQIGNLPFLPSPRPREEERLDDWPESPPPPVGLMLYHTIVTAITATLLTDIMGAKGFWSGVRSPEIVLMLALTVTMVWSFAVLMGLLGFRVVPLSKLMWGRLPQVFALHVAISMKLSNPSFPVSAGISLLSLGSFFIGLFNKQPEGVHIVVDALLLLVLLAAWPGLSTANLSRPFTECSSLGQLCVRLGFGATLGCLTVVFGLQWTVSTMAPKLLPLPRCHLEWEL